MPRHLLATAGACAIAAALLASPAAAATVSTAVTTAVRTSTANSGSPDDVTISSSGSVEPTSGTAVTMDSNNSITNQGTVGVTGSNGAIGIEATSGTTGNILNSATVTVDEVYTPTDTNGDGVIDGPFALGSDRYGILTDGAHSGTIINDGTITVDGNNSAGIWLGGVQTGDFTQDGAITVLGDETVGVHAAAVTGNVILAGTVSATGKDAIAADFSGDITGTLVVQGSITATGYRSTALPASVADLGPDNLLQGGSALMVEGNVTGGIILALPPTDSTPITAANSGSASVVSYGAAPAFVIGSTTNNIVIGPVSGTAGNFGLIIDGVVSGNGVYAGVDATGLQIAGRGGAVTITNGMSITGSVAAASNGANTTALHVGSGGNVSIIQVSGAVAAAGGTSGAAKTTAIQVDVGATVPTITNSGSIKANGADPTGTSTAILDLSGGLTSVQNSGTISATGAAAGSGGNVAIDLTANTVGATVEQMAPTTGTSIPSIVGDINFGGGNNVLDVSAGTVTGNVSFGTGTNSFALSGNAVFTGNAAFNTGASALTLTGTSIFSGAADFGGAADSLTLGDTSQFSGSLLNSGNLAVTLNGGTLDVAVPTAIGSLTVGANGILIATLSNTAGQGTLYSVSGNASFASGATLLLRLTNTTNAEGRYTILEAGTLTGASDITTKADLLPFMFTATIATDAAPNTLAVDIVRRTTAELGLNRSQSTAYNAIFAALGQDTQVEGVFLGISDGDTFRDKIRQMLPDHAGGAFESISLGSRAFAEQTADAYGKIYSAGPVDVIFSSAGWSSSKSEGNTAAYNIGGFGFSGGAEIRTGLGSFGATLNWLWNQYTSGAENIVQSDTYELAAYWRGHWGNFTAWGRGSYGIVNFSGRRSFTGMADTTSVVLTANRAWNGRLITFNGGTRYEFGAKKLFFRPSVTFDYVRLSEDGYTDANGGAALDLIVDPRTSDEFAVNGGMTIGLNLAGNGTRDSNWLRVEGEGGWREIVGGTLGATTAQFANGTPFTLTPDQTPSGWFAKVRATGGNADFALGGEVGAEERDDHTAYTLRGTLRMGF